jgi:hypothetical protein
MSLREPVYVRAGDLPLYARAAAVAPTPSWTDGHPPPLHRMRYDP